MTDVNLIVSLLSMETINILDIYYNQLLTMIFGQLSNQGILQDLIVAMESHAEKLYHSGIGKSETRNNLSKANE